MIEEIVDEYIKNAYMFTALDITQEIRRRGGTAIYAKIKSEVEEIELPGTYKKTIIQIPGISVNPWLYHPKEISDKLYRLGRKVPLQKRVRKPKKKHFTAKKLINVEGYNIPSGNKPILKRSQNHSGVISATEKGFKFDIRKLNSATNSEAVSSTTQPRIVSPTIPDFKSLTSFMVSLDKRGRYCMRASTMGKAGLFPGDKVFLFIDEKKKEILIQKYDLAEKSKKKPSTSMTVDKDSNIQIFQRYLIKAFGTVPSRLVFQTTKNQVLIREEISK